VTAEEYARGEAEVGRILERLGSARMARADAGLIADEFAFAGELLAHACRRGRFLLDRRLEHAEKLTEEIRRLSAEHRRIWLARNRPGGLADSAGRLDKTAQDYR
jgi:hexosaminidase